MTAGLDLPRYCIVGLRPVKAVRTPDGGMDVLAYDWDAGGFVREMGYAARLFVQDVEVEQVSEAQFEQYVERLRSERPRGKPVLLTNFYHFRRILEYRVDSGAHREIGRSLLPGPDAADGPGVWVDAEGRVCGVAPSPDGPVFFLGDARIPLRFGVHKGVRTVEGGRRRFILREGGREVSRVDTVSDPLEEYDPGTNGPLEFFEWLSQKLGEEHFFGLYTVR